MWVKCELNLILLHPCLSARLCPVPWHLLTVDGIYQCSPCPSTSWCVSTWSPPATTTTTSPKSSFSRAQSCPTSPGQKSMYARSVTGQDMYITSLNSHNCGTLKGLWADKRQTLCTSKSDVFVCSLQGIQSTFSVGATCTARSVALLLGVFTYSY